MALMVHFFGRRGCSLLLYALLWLLSATSIWFVSPQWVWHAISLKIWAAGFIAAAVLAIIAAFRRPPKSDRFGFLALILIGILWVVSRLTVEVLATFTGLNVDLRANAFSLLSVVFSLLKVYIDAGWSEHTAKSVLDPTEPSYHPDLPALPAAEPQPSDETVQESNAEEP